MDTSELFRSCANEHVAAAALLCVGGSLVRRVEQAAAPQGLSTGAMVARLVAEYDRKASPALRKLLLRGMRGAEMPILAGLTHVLEASLSEVYDLAPRRVPQQQWQAPVIHWAIDVQGAGEVSYSLH